MKETIIRRLTYGANVGIGIILAFILVILANALAAKYPRRYDFIQKQDLYKLSEKTLNVLKELQEPVEFYVFGNPQNSELYPKVKRLIDQYCDASSKVTCILADDYILRDPGKIQKIKNQFNVTDWDTVIVKVGEETKELKENDMGDFKFEHNYYDYGQKKKLVLFKAEQALTSAILELQNPEQKHVYFTVNHGERSILSKDDRNYSIVKEYLERDRVLCAPLELYRLSDMTETNCDLLVVAGPTRDFLEEEVEVLRRYIMHGGRALIMIDPNSDCQSIPKLLTSCNVNVGDDVTVDPTTRIAGTGWFDLVIPTYPEHEITKNLDSLSIFYMARSVMEINPENKDYIVTPFLQTTSDGWGETKYHGTSYHYDEKTDLGGPVTIGAAVENKRTGMRLVVIGDADFADNFYAERPISNRDIFLNACNWAMQREYLVSIGPKTIQEIRSLKLNRKQISLIRTLVIVLVPALALSLGLLVYVRRRQ